MSAEQAPICGDSRHRHHGPCEVYAHSQPVDVNPADFQPKDTPMADRQAWVAAVEAEAARYHDSACAYKADADRLAAALKMMLNHGAIAYIPDYFRRKCGYGEDSSRARAALARHEEHQR